jgi:transposase
VSWKTVFHRFTVWCNKRVFYDAFAQLAAQRNAEHPGLALVADTTFIKNAYGRDCVGPNCTDRGRWASKVSLLCDSAGVPLAIRLHPANVNDCRTLRCLLDTAARRLAAPLASHGELFADKGYDTQACHNACAAHGIAPRIPRRGTPEGWSQVRYVVERSFALFKHFRRLRLRYEFTARAFGAFCHLAAAVMLGRHVGH